MQAKLVARAGCIFRRKVHNISSAALLAGCRGVGNLVIISSDSLIMNVRSPARYRSSSLDIAADDEFWRSDACCASSHTQDENIGRLSPEQVQEMLTEPVAPDYLNCDEISSILRIESQFSSLPGKEHGPHLSLPSAEDSNVQLATVEVEEPSSCATLSSGIASRGSDTESDAYQKTYASSVPSSSKCNDDGNYNCSQSGTSSAPVSARRTESTASEGGDGSYASPPFCGSITGVKRSAETTSLHHDTVVRVSPSFGGVEQLPIESRLSSTSSRALGPGAAIIPHTFQRLQPEAGAVDNRIGGNSSTPMSALQVWSRLWGAETCSGVSGTAGQEFPEHFNMLEGREWVPSEDNVQPRTGEGPSRRLLKTSKGAKSKDGPPSPSTVAAPPKQKLTKEERQRNNRESADRSRMKAKKNRTNLEKRVTTLTDMVEVYREENCSLKAAHANLCNEKAFLRNENSFLRDVLFAAGKGNELPLVSPAVGAGNTSDRSGEGNDTQGVAAGRTSILVRGASAVLTVMIFSIALSAAGYGEGDEMETAARGMGKGGVRYGSGGAGPLKMRTGRSLLSIDDTIVEPGLAAQFIDSAGLVLVLVISLTLLAIAVRTVCGDSLHRRCKSFLSEAWRKAKMCDKRDIFKSS